MTRLNELPENAKIESETGCNYVKKVNSQRVYKKKGEDEIKLVIPGELPTMNEIINKAKTHWSEYKKMKDNCNEIITYMCQQQEIPFFHAVRLKITYYRKNMMYDPDNLSAGKKFILDGLQEAGCIKNDGWKEIKGFQESWEVDKENPRTEVIIKEVEHEQT